MTDLEHGIDTAWETRSTLSPQSAPAAVCDAVGQVLAGLDGGRLRVAEKIDGAWMTRQWIKKAVLLSFRLAETGAMRFERRAGSAEPFAFYDKVPTKFAGLSDDQLAATGVRVVPPAVARRGAYIAPNVVLMPSFVNIGAYVDEGTMVDTWATVGSCAQIGRRVHLSGGVGIGGVLESPQSRSVIDEDDCFIGTRAIVVEGVVVEEGAVVGAGVVLTASTPIVQAYHHTDFQEKLSLKK